MIGVQIVPVSRQHLEQALRPELPAGEHFPLIILLVDTALAEITEETDERLVIEPKRLTREPQALEEDG